MNQVKVDKAIVDNIMQQARIHHQLFDNVPVNQARMVTHFGFCLKSFGEAAVADPKAFDADFSNKMASERLAHQALPEVWAHEGWKLMQAMNDPEQYVIPLMAEAVENTLAMFGLASPNITQAFWAHINGNRDTDLLHRLEFMALDNAIPTLTNDQAAQLVWRIVETHISHYETLYAGITAYWKNDVLRAVLSDDWDARYNRLILAQPLLIGDLLDTMHHYVAELVCTDKLMHGWVTAPSLRFLTLAIFLSTGCDEARMDQPNAMQRSLYYVGNRASHDHDQDSNRAEPYADALVRAVTEKDIFNLVATNFEECEDPSSTNARHSELLLARFHESLVSGAKYAVSELNSVERDAAISWARNFLSGR